MLEEYLQLRKIGHGRKESFNRAIGYFIADLGSFLSHYNGVPEEVKLEEDLCHLETCGNLDFQSLDDLVKLPLEADKFPKTYYTRELITLTSLHLVYCHRKDILSIKQIKRYEEVLQRVPEKFDELLRAVEKDELREYGRKVSKIVKEKRKEWIELFEQINH